MDLEFLDIHAAGTIIEIAKMILENDLSIPVGHREFKREEFLKAYEKKFKVGYGTSRHEADSLQ